MHHPGTAWLPVLQGQTHVINVVVWKTFMPMRKHERLLCLDRVPWELA